MIKQSKPKTKKPVKQINKRNVAKPAKKRILSRYPKKPQPFHHVVSGFDDEPSDRIFVHYNSLPQTRISPRCGSVMEKDYWVEHDEIPCGDGDWELAQSLIMQYQCENGQCRHIIDIGSDTIGNGMLR